MTELSVRAADAQIDAHGAGGTVRVVAGVSFCAAARRHWTVTW